MQPRPAAFPGSMHDPRIFRLLERVETALLLLVAACFALGFLAAVAGA